MKHWIRHHDGRQARQGIALADELWNDGGWRTSVGRWLVVTFHESRYSLDFAVWSLAEGRFTSLRAGRAHARRMEPRGAQVIVRRWKRGAKARVPGAAGKKPEEAMPKMITRIPFKHLSPRTQVRRPVFQIRRGRERKALIRMLGCSYCGGGGGYVFITHTKTTGERVDEILIVCGECNGGIPRQPTVAVDFKAS